MNPLCLAGIDIGSTTVKAVLCDPSGGRIFSRYRRHHARTVETTRAILDEARHELGERRLALALTGSAGMGVAESFGFPFVQEVVAATRLIRRRWPDVRTLIEIGGEDSKIAFFDARFQPDIRMNGNCAGGTGAFIEQMALLLDEPLETFDGLARKSRTLHPIASRCGVFAKTDIQSLLSSRVAREEIAASVFHAMALQVISTLACGREIEGKVLFAGGPLTFFPGLREAFCRLLRLDPGRGVADCDRPELIAAEGAALHHGGAAEPLVIGDCLQILSRRPARRRAQTDRRLAPLFRDREELARWEARHRDGNVERVDLALLDRKPCFLGIDSGSTTAKILLMDDRGRVAFTGYLANGGDPVGAVRQGIDALGRSCKEAGVTPLVVRSAATGYGEELIRAAFSLDDGIVETIAHYRAARHFAPDVSFILDIGGQDMKAIHVRDGAVSDIQINEACSSGCGTFLETFARGLDYGVADFARLACDAREPFDLGTRCTVFMNSCVRQALREGATVGEISAGLAFSVIRNSLHKVLKLKDPSLLGERIVVQGGVFRNPAVLRAFELLVGREAIRPDIPELMGAFGAALTARQNHRAEPQRSTVYPGIGREDATGAAVQQEIHCRGCENRCRVTRVGFGEGRSFFTGHRCERHFTNGGELIRPGENLFPLRLRLLFDRPLEPEHPARLTFGIPRALNQYENFPFWCTLLTRLGFRVVLSGVSDVALFEKGVGSVMSENICFPAKLAHGHIVDLVEKGVDRILYPIVVCEGHETPGGQNRFNCPIVTGYPDVVRSAIDPEGRFGVPIDRPAVSFREEGLLKQQLQLFFRPFGIGKRRVADAVERGLEAARQAQALLQRRAALLIERARAEGRFVVVVAGRPYHADPLINHGLPELLAALGVDVIPESAVPATADGSLSGCRVLTQWAYPNRLLSVAGTVAGSRGLEIVQVTSFGCGLDAISADEVREVIRGAGKIYSLIKMDEITNQGAVRVRLRSMLEAIRERSRSGLPPGRPRPVSDHPGRDGGEGTILVPWFSPLYSPFIPAIFESFGYRAELLPPQDRSSVDTGLRYVNNDMCYPALIVIGDIINAFRSGRYDAERTSVLLTQTFGQCRASNYLPLAQKALAAAGFGSVPVISLAVEENGAGMRLPLDRRALTRRLALALVFGDQLARMTLATIPHELSPGASMALQRRYIAETGRLAAREDFKALLGMLRRAVREFNALPADGRTAPRIGVLGEIFVKFNALSNLNLVEWLTSRGIEVILPPLTGFFEQRFVNEEFDQRARLKQSYRELLLTRLVDRYVRFHTVRVERVMRGFRYYRRHEELRLLAAEASRATSLANQAGEGWLLPAEMVAMIGEGIENIVCLQPFGCLSNQVIGKGLEKKLKSLYKPFNLLFLDMDPGTSEVNILNRLHFLVMAAQEGMQTEGVGQQK